MSLEIKPLLEPTKAVMGACNDLRFCVSVHRQSDGGEEDGDGPETCVAGGTATPAGKR